MIAADAWKNGLNGTSHHRETPKMPSAQPPKWTTNESDCVVMAYQDCGGNALRFVALYNDATDGKPRTAADLEIQLKRVADHRGIEVAPAFYSALAEVVEGKTAAVPVPVFAPVVAPKRRTRVTNGGKMLTTDELRALALEAYATLGRNPGKQDWLKACRATGTGFDNSRMSEVMRALVDEGKAWTKGENYTKSQTKRARTVANPAKVPAAPDTFPAPHVTRVDVPALTALAQGLGLAPEVAFEKIAAMIMGGGK